MDMNVALILSGGTGVRLGSDTPKQYIKVGGKMVLSYCLEKLSTHVEIDAIQIVADKLWRKTITDCLAQVDTAGKFRGFSAPGRNRQLSIYHGLEDIRLYAKNTDYVLIHDGARPLLSKEMITACLNGVVNYDGAIPILPMKDTVYISKDGRTISSLLNRNEVYAGQAPEIFRLGPYYDANKSLLPDRILSVNGSTEPAVLAGLHIAMIPGDERNFKLTTKADLEKFQRIVEDASHFD